MTTLTHRNIIRDNASQLAYTGATDFNGVRNQEYPLIYNESGSLVSDAGRNIANIEYDKMNNPVRIQFTNGNVTKYVYSAAGEKLRVTYQTAVPNITVATGSTRELAPSETLYTDSIDYLLGGALTLRNGRVDKFLFDEGYCQAERDVYNPGHDDFTFCYYDKDHLGNVRQVTALQGSSGGNVIQRNNYYPFGGIIADLSMGRSVQNRLYNGKELDTSNNLWWYDYGARQYDPTAPRFTTPDPLAHKYYGWNMYGYCVNNPVMFVDLDGRDPGSFFKTADDAAKDFGRVYNPLSITYNIEYGASIFKTRNYKGEVGYTYTVPLKGKGDKTFCSTPPFGIDIEAQIHSHGATIEGMANNLFSGEDNTSDSADLDNANKMQINIYLAAPNGTLRKYDYQTKEISVIDTTLPNDNAGSLSPDDYKHSFKNESLGNRALDNINAFIKAFISLFSQEK